jgi:hypothetical protein
MKSFWKIRKVIKFVSDITKHFSGGFSYPEQRMFPDSAMNEYMRQRVFSSATVFQTELSLSHTFIFGRVGDILS